MNFHIHVMSHGKWSSSFSAETYGYVHVCRSNENYRRYRPHPKMATQWYYIRCDSALHVYAVMHVNVVHCDCAVCVWTAVSQACQLLSFCRLCEPMLCVQCMPLDSRLPWERSWILKWSQQADKNETERLYLINGNHANSDTQTTTHPTNYITHW